MKQHGFKLVLGMLIVSLVSWGSLAQASDKSASIFPAEGNVQCNDYSSNSVIKEMDTNSPTATGTLTGLDNPNDADSDPESASYTVDGGTVVGFSGSSTPIDYALLKSGRAVSVHIYPSGGVTEDANMKLMVDGVAQPVSAISLCYGLGNQAPSPPEPLVLPSCNDFTGFDGVGIQCPSDGTRSVVINMELDASFYNTNGTKMACICNDTPKVQCDPNVTSDDPNGCPINDPYKSGTEVTTHIEFNNDPYFCLTIGNERTCYPY